ncbi:MAG: UDP-2,4-diacetamido-2,4,6-trideoxy-beta-L-altropyranose hydrolase [Magnetospirillum sp.]|nr:UDP-2,4-diacetamido-2,4,6-trideoxy-beta-L-altropyranose hydrolase [Magnetospirillum sp.]
MVTPTVIFRADASAAIGTGHIMRCLTLADVLAARGVACVFASEAGSAVMVPSLAYPVVPPSAMPAAHLVVVDHYGLDEADEAMLGASAGALMAVDDLPTRVHRCALLLDQTHGRRAEEYAELVPPDCLILAGSDYALLRPQFGAARATALARRDCGLKRILVSLGGSDPDDVTGAVLDAIAASGLDVAVEVVMGAAAPHLEQVRRRAATLPQARVQVGVSDMAALMVEADLAIGAGGGTAWERCCLGLPTLMLTIADNQRDVVRLVTGAGAAQAATLPSLARQLRELTPAALTSMSAAAARLCDGGGADRVADAIMSFLSSKGVSP